MISEIPGISVVTVNYNMAPFLERAIRSVLDQGYANLEYIIIDGGSTDGSVDIIKKYSDRLTYWVSEKDSGQSNALNKGLAKCSGDIVAWLNADDYYEQDTFGKVAGMFKKMPDDCGVLVGACRMIYQFENEALNKTEIVSHKSVSKASLTAYWKNYFIPPQPSVFWKREVMQKAGLLNERLQYVMDYDLWLRFSEITRFCCIPDILSNYLVHDTSKSGSGAGIPKFAVEWNTVAKQFISRQSFAFKLHNKWQLFSFSFMAVLSGIANGVTHSLKGVLGAFVRIIKKLTGIKRFGLLSNESQK